jgi:hypothetical protein
MRKQAPDIEWQIVESDADWERLHISLLPDITSDTLHGLRLQRSLSPAVVLLLLLASAGGWWWRSALGSAHQAAADGMAATPSALGAGAPDHTAWANHVPRAQMATAGRHPVAPGSSDLLTAIQTDASAAHVEIAVSMIEFHGNRAVANIVTAAQHGAPAYRQTRFYRRTSTAWAPAPPDAALWGPERSLATPYFVFHFRQHDAPAVMAVAPQIDALYMTLRHNLGLESAPGSKKLVIEVSVTQTPADTLAWFRLPGPLTVPSPAVYLAPVELSDAELLAQSISLSLLNYSVAQASQHDASRSNWAPLLHGLRLWQLWDLEAPLSVWRGDVVKWLYLELPATHPGQPLVLPEHYIALCAAHKLWMPSPAQLNIPLMCARAEWEELSFPLQLMRDPPMRLDQLIVPLRPGEYTEELDSLHHVAPHPGQTVALATLIEYAVATYGRELLPVLVRAWGTTTAGKPCCQRCMGCRLPHSRPAGARI